MTDLTPKEIAGENCGYKQCSNCNKPKPISSFYTRKGSIDGLRGNCKSCQNKYARAYRKRNSEKMQSYEKNRPSATKERKAKEYRKSPERVRQNNLSTKFGITITEYNKMHMKQNGKCAICGETETSRYKGIIKLLAVDHCHKTNTNRGLLCSKCNTGLGMFRENLDLLASAASYLINNRCKIAE